MNEEDRIYKGNGKKLTDLPALKFRQKTSYRADKKVIDAVNTAIYLRRPLLVKGKPGLGKSSLAKSIADDLDVKFIPWRITSKSTLESGLYSYDAIARLHDASRGEEKDISEYLKLGPLGSAFAYLSETLKEGDRKKCVLLIDEIDKSDIDLPNDLLHILEEHEFVIPELERMKGKKNINFYRSKDTIEIEDGKVVATDIPIVIMTSNDSVEFPTAFLRRCIQTTIGMPSEEELEEIVKEHFGDISALDKALVAEYHDRVAPKGSGTHLAIDQLLNAIYLLREKLFDSEEIDDIKKDDILELVLKSLE